MLKAHPPKKKVKVPDKVMSKEETKRMLEAVPLDSGKPNEFRDRVILELMYSCSLRRSEVVALVLADFDIVGKTLTIRGQSSKTNVGRVVPIGSLAHGLLTRYLKEIRPKTALNTIFLNYKGHQLSEQHISKLVLRLRRKLGLMTKATSHSFRKSSATHMLRNGARLGTVQALLGHAEISSTQAYTKVYPQDIIKMHEEFHPRG